VRALKLSEAAAAGSIRLFFSYCVLPSEVFLGGQERWRRCSHLDYLPALGLGEEHEQIYYLCMSLISLEIHPSDPGAAALRVEGHVDIGLHLFFGFVLDCCRDFIVVCA
jgi:hypothetical protein